MSADDIDFPTTLRCEGCEARVRVHSQRAARMELLACPNHFGAGAEVVAE